MILLTPKKVTFTWFASLINDNVSKRSAYLVYTALNETETVIKDSKSGYRLIINKPKSMVIDSSNPIYRTIIKYVSSIASYMDKVLHEYDDYMEFEFNYNPDVLGMYLAGDVNYEGSELKRGLYIIVPNIIRYITTLERQGLFIDPNVIIGTVFYHEYMHMILNTLGLSNASKCINVLCLNHVAEVMCEGLSLTTLPENLDSIYSDYSNGAFLNGELYIGGIQGESTINVLNYEIKIRYVHQLIDKETFLKLPRIYPYRLARNFFYDNEKIGWLLIGELLSTMIGELTTKSNKINEIKMQPKVFIVINDGSREEYTISLGHRYDWSHSNLIY